MKYIAIATASLLLLSAVWVGADASPAPGLYSELAAPKTRTPKATREVVTKPPKSTRTLRPTKTARPKKANFSGEVLAVGAAGLTIKTGSGEEMFFVVTADTTVKIPSLGRDGTLADIQVGVRALVRAVESEGGGYTATQISVSPGKPAPKHHVGEVTAYEAGVSITILALDGNEYTFLLTEETKILPAERAEELAVGRRVTIISPRDVTGGPFTAKGIVVHPETGDDKGTPEGTPTETPTPTETQTPTPTDTPTPEFLPTDTATPTVE
ncbi:MAG: hypothetical protein JW748_04310 [Anaerolineales bacterium]|nr:hypothetical protein [Anaerolineales bacterium]